MKAWLKMFVLYNYMDNHINFTILMRLTITVYMIIITIKKISNI